MHHPTSAVSSVRPRWSRRALLAAGVLGGAALLARLARPLYQTRPLPTPEHKLPLWSLELPPRGAIVAGVLPAGERLYLAAVRDHAFRPSGAVYALDLSDSGARIEWTYDDGGAMLQTISTPALISDLLCVGEGMHGDFLCKLHALNAITGRKVWQAKALGHIESGPSSAFGLVFFSGGDDGLHAVDARTGALRWRFQADLHIDTRPEPTANGLLFAGGGISRHFRNQAVVCLEAPTGRPVWRTPVDLPVWGSPVADAGDVLVGLGNGRLTQSAEPPERPAGALLCLETSTGGIRWRVPAGDGVLVRPAVDSERAYFVSRDGFVRAVRRTDGLILWQTSLGAPLAAAPTLCDGRLYVAADVGPLACLEAVSGRVLWIFDVAVHSRTVPRLLSAPAVVPGSKGRMIYLGTELRSAASSAAVLYALEDREEP